MNRVKFGIRLLTPRLTQPFVRCKLFIRLVVHPFLFVGKPQIVMNVGYVGSIATTF